MLSPTPPMDNSGAEKKRYKADCANKKKNPRDYGIIRRVPTAIAALGRKASDLYLKAEAAQPPGKGAKSSQADQEKIKKLTGDLEATRSHAEAMQEGFDGACRQLIITRSIGQMLHNGEWFGKDQKPDVSRLEKLTGLKDITAIERNILWKDISEVAA